jgi:cystathionine gamma-lyase
MAEGRTGREWSAATRAVHAGLPEGAPGEPLLPGPVFAAPFHLPGDPADSPYGYGRYGNPTWSRYEAALGELDGGEAVAFASGMAAITSLLGALVPPDGAAVLPADGYFTTRQVGELLAARGVEVRLAACDAAAYADALDGAAFALVETPTNPGLDVCDVAAVADAARGAGALLAVDNSLATPLLQSPLALGADLVVTSGTKGLSGHADLVIGHVSARDSAHADALRTWRRQTGPIPGPFEAWLAHRSLATLGVRLERQCANAQALAERLAARDDVAGVRYPGLADDPAHAVAARQMRGFGPVLGFDLGDADRAQRFLAGCQLVIEATSFGGIYSSAERRARWASDAIGPGYVRLNAGIEDTADLVADVEAALAVAPNS